jgi:hypothetical protein
MRLLSQVGVGFSPLSIAAPLLLATAAAGYITWRRTGTELPQALRGACRAAASPPGLEGATLLAWRTLLAWIALRFLLLGMDVSWQPLYPWDAWTQWATKARVWYDLGRIAPFAPSAEWFTAGGTAYFDAQPDNPPTVPLLQVWACISLGRWDDALMNWPWWQTGAALACAVYGALRSLAVPALGALVATYLVASLPLANVHVALAGYADLPMAAYYACAVLAFLRWAATRDRHDAALTALLALACTQIAIPGLAWALTLLPGVIVVLLPRAGLKVAAGGLAALLFALAVAAQTRMVVMGHALHLEFAPAWSALAESYLLFGNWNLLWYAVPVAALLAWRQLAAPALAPLTVIAATAAILLLAVFAFPEAAARFAGRTTFNRATLHFAPVAVVFAVLAFREFATRWIAAAADTQGT